MTVLYDLLSVDKNVYHLYQILKNGSVSFAEILEKFQNGVQEEELIALIDIINVAEKNGIGLFDLKYHSFVRPLSGAYVTIGDSPKCFTKSGG